MEGLQWGGNFPFEIVKLKMSGMRVSGSPWQGLEADWGYCAAQLLFDSKNIICQEDFHLVWWDGLRATMSSYPEMYRAWLTKHVSDFCGTNAQLYYWSKGTHSPKCNFCVVKDKYTMHICQCRDPGCNSMIWVSVNELCSWVKETLGNTNVTATIEMYLLARGTVTMSSCVHGNNADLLTAVSVSNLLGWDSFIEGPIVTQWQTVATSFLLRRSSVLLPSFGGMKLITKLHNIIHKQWIYCNSVIHFKGKDVWTLPEQHTIMSKVAKYSMINPDIIPPCHWFLFNADFEALGSGPTLQHLLWLAEVDTALSASSLSELGSLTPQASAFFSTCTSHTFTPASQANSPVPTAGRDQNM
jgi:hypothetical protein